MKSICVQTASKYLWAPLLIMMSGCIGIMRQTESHPSVQEIKAKRIRYSRGQLFEYDGVGFDAYIENPRLRGLLVFPIPFPIIEQTRWDTTSVYVLLRPSRDRGTFDPSQIVWRDTDGQAYSPTHLYRGPYPCETMPPHRTEAFNRALPVVPFALPVNEATCFDVTFSFPSPDVTEDFKIELSGLAFEGKNFSLPTIHFKKSSRLETIAIP